MQSFQEAANSALSTVSAGTPKPANSETAKPITTAQSSTSSVNASTMTRMRTLWIRMAEIYGHRWTSAYGDDPNHGAALTWAKGLQHMTPAQLAHGLSSALSSVDGWPPTLPEFRAMCLDIPTMASVRYRMAHPGDTVSPFMRLFWSFLNGAEYNSGDEYRCERAVKEAYELASEHVMQGKALPEPAAAAITHAKREKPVPASDQTVKQHLEQIRRQLGMGEEEGSA